MRNSVVWAPNSLCSVISCLNQGPSGTCHILPRSMYSMLAIQDQKLPWPGDGGFFRPASPFQTVAEASTCSQRRDAHTVHRHGLSRQMVQVVRGRDVWNCQSWFQSPGPASRAGGGCARVIKEGFAGGASFAACWLRPAPRAGRGAQARVSTQKREGRRASSRLHAAGKAIAGRDIA